MMRALSILIFLAAATVQGHEYVDATLRLHKHAQQVPVLSNRSTHQSRIDSQSIMKLHALLTLIQHSSVAEQPPLIRVTPHSIAVQRPAATLHQPVVSCQADYTPTRIVGIDLLAYINKSVARYQTLLHQIAHAADSLITQPPHPAFAPAVAHADMRAWLRPAEPALSTGHTIHATADHFPLIPARIHQTKSEIIRF
jgi:hypothetical protein